jgi:hypothetical protein
MKKIFFPLVMVAVLAMSACASPTGIGTTQPSSSDQVATIVAATMQAVPSNTPMPLTADACQIPTFKASDAPSDCFNASGEPVGCAGLDLLGVEAGLLTSVPAVVDEPSLPTELLGAVGYTGFVVTFADPPQAAEEFVLYLYLDLDEDAVTGFDMSSGARALPGIDRLIGVALPSGESWTQIVAKGGYDAEIIRDEAQVSARVVGEKVIVFVLRKLLDDRTVAAGGNTPPSVGSLVTVGYLPRSHAGGMLVSPFSLYVGTTRSIETLDFFNGDQAIHAPLAMTVPEEAQTPLCTGGS